VKAIALIFTLLLFSMILPTGISYAEEVYLETLKGDISRIPVTVIVNGNNSDAVSNIRKVLEYDLDRSLYFDLIKVNGFDVFDIRGGVPSRLDENMRMQLRSLGIDSVIMAFVTKDEKGIKLDGKIYETGSGELIYVKRYMGNDNLLRRLVHRFSDEIVFRLTGEKGIAQTRIVFISDQTGQKELYIMDYDGYSPKMITGNRSLNLSPSWSPSGSLIAYTSYRDGNPDIYIVDLGTSKRWRLTDYSGLDISPSWSPDGNVMAFATSRDGNAEIYMMNRDGKGVKRLTYMRGEDVSPTWSPTGSEIAFTSDRGGSPQIYVMKADGTNVRRLTFKGEYNSDAVWSPRGNKIAFA